MILFDSRIEEPPIPLSVLEVKALVRHRDGYACTDCGMTAEQHLERFGRNLDVHRVVPGSEYTLPGCVTLCRPCHDRKPKSPKGSRPRTHRLMAIPRCLYEGLKILAERNRRTVAKQLEVILEEALIREGVRRPEAA
jgi:hypothetical protein